MNRTLLALLVLLLLLPAGCRSDPAQRLASPAPPGALDCARRVLGELGYREPGGHFDRARLYLERPPGELVASVLIVEEGEGELRVFAATRNHRNRYAPPTEEALGHVRAMFSACVP